MLTLAACAPGGGRHIQITEVPKLDNADWQQYRQRFVAADGRVVDNGQGGVSHSEGQGYAMFLAVAFDDRAVFDQLWRWTRQHLQVRANDKRLAWLWNPDCRKATDLNNATDGDLFVSWALLRASDRWEEAEYAAAARAILDDLLPLEVAAAGQKVLLPGGDGFRREEGVVLNPSYWTLPAYAELASFHRGIDWQRHGQGARALFKKATFGKWDLPPDWLLLSGRSRIAPWSQRPPLYSYDAIRVPLFLAWAGEADLLAPFLKMWKELGNIDGWPATIDLQSKTITRRTDFVATGSIAALCRHVDGEVSLFPAVDWHAGITYFDASLQLFSQIAWIEFDQSILRGNGS